MKPRRIGFFASKNGSGMKAVGRAIADGRLQSEIVLLLTNNPGCAAEDWAIEHGIPVEHIGGNPEEADADMQCLAALAGVHVDLIILSGFLRKLGPKVLSVYSPGILNVHPALLPKYGGKGMYGAHVHRAVLAAGEPVSGASVHIVDPNYDEGPVVARKQVPVEDGETLDGLSEKVMQAERELLVDVIATLEAGSLDLGKFG